MSDTTVPAGNQPSSPWEDRQGPFQPGARVGGRYTIEERIGVGGMGIVYRARQDLTDKQVALKVIRSRRGDGVMLDRFLDEIRLLGRLEHHGLASIHDADLHARSEGGDVLFFTMDLVEGVPITTWAQQQGLDRGARLALIARVCEAMQYAHDHGVIHCDLKPGNILVRRRGEPVIIDFGLAYLRENVAGAEPGASVPGESRDGWGRGIAGTPPYTSPEQFQGGIHELRAGQSVDVHALGVVTFELLAGRVPYDLPPSPKLADLRRAMLFSPVHRLVDFLPEVDPELDRVIAKALRRDPADRYFSVAQFLRALSRFLPAAAPAPDDVWRPAVGEIIPSTNWILDEKLGEGGVGEVWTCHHRSLKNKRIVKFCTDEDKASFLRRELTLYKLLKEKVGQNPHFARLEEVALEEPPRYLMSEFIEARDFSKWCADKRREAPIPEAALLEIVAQSADALQAAHDAGVIHRDIKPSNLLLRGEPADLASIHVWVGDFGIGQVVSEEILGDGTRSGFTRTLLGKALSSYSGTHLYMAPELLTGGDASVRSDIYALGVVLYQALAGDFQRTLTINWADDIPDPLLRADLGKCFARDPAARFPSAAQLADRLRRLPERRDQRARAEQESLLRERRAYRRGLLRAGAIAGAIVALVAGLAWYGFHQSGVAWRARAAAVRGEAAAVRGEAAAVRAEGAAVRGQAAALRQSQTPSKRFLAWRLIVAGAADCPDDQREAFREEAVAVLALPSVSFEPIASLGMAEPLWVSSAVTSAASLAGDNSVVLHHRVDERWERLGELPAAPSAITRLGVSNAGRVVGAMLEDGKSATVNFGQSWRPVVATSGGLAVTDPGTAAVARPDGTIEIFRADRPEGPVLVLSAGNPTVPPSSKPRPVVRAARDLAFDPAGQRLAAASAESLLVMVWDARTGGLLAAGEHLHAVSSLAWNPAISPQAEGQRTPESERVLATGSEDGIATLWDLDHRKGPALSEDHLFLVPTRRIPPPTAERVGVRQVAFSASGRELMVLYTNDALAAFDCQSGGFIDLIIRPSKAAAFAVSLDGHLALQGTERRTTFSSSARPPLNESRVFFGKVTEVDSDTEGKLLLARAHEGMVLLDPLHLRELHRFNQGFGNTGRFHPMANDALVAIGRGRPLMWERVADQADPRTIRFRGPDKTQPNDFVEMDMIRLGEDRARTIAKGDSLIIRASGMAKDLTLKVLPAGTIRRQRVHPSGDWIAVIANEMLPPMVVNFKSRASTPLPVAAGKFLDVAFSPDGRFLVLRDAAAVHVLGSPAWEPLFQIPLPSRLSTDAPMAFSHDSSLFVACGGDGVPVLHRVPATDTGRWPPVARLSGPQIRDATCARFGGPGHCLLLVGTADGYLQAWNIAELRRSLSALRLDWDGPVWEWPEHFIPCEKVEVIASDQ